MALGKADSGYRAASCTNHSRQNFQLGFGLSINQNTQASKGTLQCHHSELTLSRNSDTPCSVSAIVSSIVLLPLARLSTNTTDSLKRNVMLSRRTSYATNSHKHMKGRDNHKHMADRRRFGPVFSWVFILPLHSDSVSMYDWPCHVFSKCNALTLHINLMPKLQAAGRAEFTSSTNVFSRSQA